MGCRAQKAFNRIIHNLILTKLLDMGVPGWLLRIVVVAFLKDRKMLVRYKGKAVQHQIFACRWSIGDPPWVAPIYHIDK